MPKVDGRRAILTDDPLGAARDLNDGRALVTPNERASRSVAGDSAHHLSLQAAALRLLANGEGVWRAPPETQASVLREVVAEVLSPSDVRGSARAHEPAVRELLRAGLGRPDVDARLQAARHELSERTRDLLDLATGYRRGLAELNAVDPSELLWRASDAVSRRERLLVSGYPRLGADELALLDAWAADGSVVVLPAGYRANAASAAWLEERGWTVENHVGSGNRIGRLLGHRFTAVSGDGTRDDTGAGTGADTGAGTGATVISGAGSTDSPAVAWRAGDQEDEVRLVLAHVKSLLARGVKPAEIVLVARDEQAYGPLLTAVAFEYRVPLKLSYAVPLKRTRLGAFITQLAEVVLDDLPYEATARLLAHPFLRLLDSGRWRTARQQRTEGWRAWRELVAETVALDWPRTAGHRDYQSLLEECLTRLGALARIQSSPLDARAWRKLTTALRRPQPLGARITRGAFLADVDETLDLHSVPIDSPWSRGVELHSPLAVVGAQYQHVIVLGAAEGMLPATVSDDPVLDFHQRSALRSAGLPLEDALAAAERESLSFLPTVQAARATFTITFPELLGNREQIPSPYFSALGLTPQPAPLRQTAGELELLTLTLAGAHSGDEDEFADDRDDRRAWRVELARESATPPDVFDGVIGPGGGYGLAQRIFSASQLMVLGQCPFHWFADGLLRLAEPKELEDDVSPTALGNLFHTTLELALAAARRELGAEAGASELREATSSKLAWAFAEAENEHGSPATESWPLQRPTHLATLARAVASPDFLLEGATVLELEARFETAWRGLRVRGRVDRIDGTDYGLVLTDYKLGKGVPLGAKDSRGRPALDVQLPLYIEAAAPQLLPERPVASARYYSINGAATLREARVDDAELSALVTRITGHFEEGSFPVEPDADQRVCAYCPYDPVCRRGPRLGRKAAARAQTEAPPGETDDA